MQVLRVNAEALGWQIIDLRPFTIKKNSAPMERPAEKLLEASEMREYHTFVHGVKGCSYWRDDHG
jgi:hypothetical protein